MYWLAFIESEIYNKKLILYGCGYLVNDYQGINFKHDQQFRGDLSLLYFIGVNHKSGNFVSMEIVPMEICHMRLESP